MSTMSHSVRPSSRFSTSRFQSMHLWGRGRGPSAQGAGKGQHQLSHAGPLRPLARVSLRTAFCHCYPRWDPEAGVTCPRAQSEEGVGLGFAPGGFCFPECLLPSPSHSQAHALARLSGQGRRWPPPTDIVGSVPGLPSTCRHEPPSQGLLPPVSSVSLPDPQHTTPHPRRPPPLPSHNTSRGSQHYSIEAHRFPRMDQDLPRQASSALSVPSECGCPAHRPQQSPGESGVLAEPLVPTPVVPGAAAPSTPLTCA